MDLCKLAGGVVLGGKDAHVHALPEEGKAPADCTSLSKISAEEMLPRQSGGNMSYVQGGEPKVGRLPGRDVIELIAVAVRRETPNARRVPAHRPVHGYKRRHVRARVAMRLLLKILFKTGERDQSSTCAIMSNSLSFELDAFERVFCGKSDLESSRMTSERGKGCVHERFYSRDLLKKGFF